MDAIFLAIHNRSYMPGYVPLQTAPPLHIPFSAPSAPATSQLQDASRNLGTGELPPSRKRSYNERQEDIGTGDSHYGRGDRQVKQIRQNGGRGGRVEVYGPRRGRGGFQLPGTAPNIPQGPVLGFPSLPMPAPRLPFDPNDPMATMIAMQAIGLPSFPGMPPLSLPTSPNGYDQFGAQRAPIADSFINVRSKINCRDYDTKGYCERGVSCPYEHNDHIIVPGQDGRKGSIWVLSTANRYQNTIPKTQLWSIYRRTHRASMIKATLAYNEATPMIKVQDEEEED